MDVKSSELSVENGIIKEKCVNADSATNGGTSHVSEEPASACQMLKSTPDEHKEAPFKSVREGETMEEERNTGNPENSAFSSAEISKTESQVEAKRELEKIEDSAEEISMMSDAPSTETPLNQGKMGSPNNEESTCVRIAVDEDKVCVESESKTEESSANVGSAASLTVVAKTVCADDKNSESKNNAATAEELDTTEMSPSDDGLEEVDGDKKNEVTIDSEVGSDANEEGDDDTVAAVKENTLSNGRKAITVEDNGDSLPKVEEETLEEKFVDKTISDEDYFATLDPSELDWFKEHGEAPEKLLDQSLHCTACFKQVTMQMGSASGIWRHPLLGVIVCKNCRLYFDNGEGWEKDEEGCDIYCRWCAEGGELILCDNCPSAFCKRCLQRNLGRKKISEITSAEEWYCLSCDPKQIYHIKSIYYVIYKLCKAGKIRKVEVDATMASSKKKHSTRKGDVTLKQEEPCNFLDENFDEAFKLLGVYQKCLEQERDGWLKSGRKMELSTATTVSRALRKIYASTMQEMELLDKAIVQSYVEKFPMESTHIYMDQDDAVEGKSAKKVAAKRKILPKKKKPSGNVEKKRSQIEPSPFKKGKTTEVVRPVLRRKMPMSDGKSKVSTRLFTRKRTIRKYSSDSDVEILSSGSLDEDTLPSVSRKRSRTPSLDIPSPASKKRKSGRILRR